MLAFVLSAFLLAGAVPAVHAAGVSPHGEHQGFPVVRVTVAGAPVQGDVPAVNLNGRTMVPLRFVAEALGHQVAWDDANYTAKIDEFAVSVHGSPEFKDRIHQVLALLQTQPEALEALRRSVRTISEEPMGYGVAVYSKGIPITSKTMASIFALPNEAARYLTLAYYLMYHAEILQSAHQGENICDSGLQQKVAARSHKIVVDAWAQLLTQPVTSDQRANIERTLGNPTPFTVCAPGVSAFKLER